MYASALVLTVVLSHTSRAVQPRARKQEEFRQTTTPDFTLDGDPAQDKSWFCTVLPLSSMTPNRHQKPGRTALISDNYTLLSKVRRSLRQYCAKTFFESLCTLHHLGITGNFFKVYFLLRTDFLMHTRKQLSDLNLLNVPKTSLKWSTSCVQYKIIGCFAHSSCTRFIHKSSDFSTKVASSRTYCFSLAPQFWSQISLSAKISICFFRVTQLLDPGYYFQLSALPYKTS